MSSGPDVGKRATVPSDRRPNRIDDEDVTSLHVLLPSRQKSEPVDLGV